MVVAVSAIEDDWLPIVPESSITYKTYIKTPERVLDTSHSLKIINRRPTLTHFGNSNKISKPIRGQETCSVYKVSMNQELFYQYIEYEKNIPDLKEFTLCMWTKFHNHSEDHPLFSYSVGDNHKEISSWISNTDEASYFSMAVHGQTFFRLNYPLKLNTWYHSCQSWNGKTGEWQIWVNAERVGRGFHNRLVGHKIKGGGTAISGQEQSLLYTNKESLEHVAIQNGFMGEITMLQMYHVALTAGKAHKDHKHHHAHHFKHDGTPIESSTEPPPEPPMPQPQPIGNGAYLIGGQIQTVPNLNLAGQQQQMQMIPVQLSNGYQLQQPYINGQLGNRIISEQLINSVSQINSAPHTSNSFPGLQLSSISSQGFPSLGPSKPSSVILSGSLLNPANVQFIDETGGHSVFRRDSVTRDKRDNPEKEAEAKSNAGGKKDKRGLVALSDGSVVDEALLSPKVTDDDEETVLQQSLLNGLAGFVGNLPVQNAQKEQVDEREPAEAEVKAVMNVCTGCTPEPFKKALILSWRSTPKKLHSGAHYYKGLPICRAF